MGTTWGWVKDGRICIFVWNISWNDCSFPKTVLFVTEGWDESKKLIFLMNMCSHYCLMKVDTGVKCVCVSVLDGGGVNIERVFAVCTSMLTGQYIKKIKIFSIKKAKGTCLMILIAPYFWCQAIITPSKWHKLICASTAACLWKKDAGAVNRMSLS